MVVIKQESQKKITLFVTKKSPTKNLTENVSIFRGYLITILKPLLTS